MATRIYFPSSGAAAISPAFSAAVAWNLTTGADRLAAVRSRIGSSMANKSSNNNGTGTGSALNSKHLVRQYVYGPIAAQTFSGTFKGQVRVSESASSTDHRACVAVTVVAPGGTVRGTVFANSTTTAANPAGEYPFAQGQVNRKHPWVSQSPASCAAIAASDGDYIVFEFGTNGANTSTNNRFVTLTFGDDSATDLAEDETTTTADNPWIEFTMDILDLTFSNPAFFGLM